MSAVGTVVDRRDRTVHRDGDSAMVAGMRGITQRSGGCLSLGIRRFCTGDMDR